MDGTDYTQSTALLRYAGKLGGTYPECPLAALKVDEIVMIAEDVFINLFSTMGEKDEAKKVNPWSHVNGNGSSDGDNHTLNNNWKIIDSRIRQANGNGSDSDGGDSDDNVDGD